MTLLKKEPVNTITNRIHNSVDHTISFGYSVFFSSILKNKSSFRYVFRSLQCHVMIAIKSNKYIYGKNLGKFVHTLYSI